MARNEVPDWFAAIIMIVILGAIFPIALQKIVNGLVLGIIIGVFVGIVVVAVWWYLENH